MTNFSELSAEKRKHLLDHMKNVNEVAVTLMYCNGTSESTDTMVSGYYAVL